MLGMGNAGNVIVDFSIQAADLGPSWARGVADLSADEHMVDGVDIQKPIPEGVLNFGGAGEERSEVLYLPCGFLDFAIFFPGWQTVGISRSGFVFRNGVHGVRRELIHRLDEPFCTYRGTLAICCIFESECDCDFSAI